ncbi:MAG: hypothetical protein PGN24_12075 [Microbacterium arborescens]
MPRSPERLPPTLGDAFSRATASALGVSPKRLRAGDLEIPFRGVRRRVAGTTVAPDDVPDTDPLAVDRARARRVISDARAYATIMHSDAFFCGRTAAILHGTGIGGGVGVGFGGSGGGSGGGRCDVADELEVGVLAPARAPRRRGIRGRQFAPVLVEVTTVAGLRLTTPASTWAMLARDAGIVELVRVGDAFVRVPRGPGGTRLRDGALATPEQLALAARAGRRVGIAKLTSALSLIRVGAMSPLETDCRLALTSAGLPEPVLDLEIRDGAGRLVGIADAAWPAHRVIAEVEGDHHRTSRRQWNRDIEKHAALVALGYEVIRLTASHIRGPRPAAVALVGDALRRRGWSPARSSV